MPHDEALAEFQLARTLPRTSPERAVRLNAVLRRAEGIDARALAERVRVHILET
jgi:hypothetical protein